jgi:hypothetical protein
LFGIFANVCRNDFAAIRRDPYGASHNPMNMLGFSADRSKFMQTVDSNPLHNALQDSWSVLLGACFRATA